MVAMAGPGRCHAFTKAASTCDTLQGKSVERIMVKAPHRRHVWFVHKGGCRWNLNPTIGTVLLYPKIRICS